MIRFAPMLALFAAAVSSAQAPQPAAAPPASTAPRPTPQSAWPTREGDVTLRDFRFADGETLPALRIHYTLLGTPHRDARGRIDNAVMVLHGTGGTGKQFLQPQFADPLYGPGAPLDLRRFFVVLPDNIGHGGSSKPSDGMRMRFPRYDYADMVEAQRRMLGALGVTRLRMLIGTSMGCMHAFVWGEAHPEMVRAMMPLACEPIQIAGLNRMWRQMVIDGIEADPAWQRGDYAREPMQGLRTAESLLFVAGSAPLNYQAAYPTRDAAAAFARRRIDAALSTLDANDLIYQVDSSRTYDPWPHLEAITVPTVWINSADDFINPHGLDVPERAVRRMRDAHFRLIPESADTHGHGTHTWAVFWKDDLAALLARTAGD